MAILELSCINNTEYRANTEGRFEKLFLQKLLTDSYIKGLQSAIKLAGAQVSRKIKATYDTTIVFMIFCDHEIFQCYYYFH